MKYNYSTANNLNQSAQTDSSNDENNASENVQTIYSVPVSNVLNLFYKLHFSTSMKIDMFTIIIGLLCDWYLEYKLLEDF